VSGQARRGLARQAASRELAVLVDGPRRARWYWRDDLESSATAARRMVECGQQPSDEWIPHPADPDVHGRVWRYRGAAAISRGAS